MQELQIGDISLSKTSKSKTKSLDHTGSSNARISEPQDGEGGDISKKRKRDELDESDPTFREYLQVMQPSSKRAGGIVMENAPTTEIPPAAEIKATESDDEYEDVPARHKIQKRREAESAPGDLEPTAQVPKEPPQHHEAENAPAHVEESQAPAVTKDATDDEWLRSRTNRLLDLLDDDEPPPPKLSAPAQVASEHEEEATMTGIEAGHDPPTEAPQPGTSKVDESAAADPQQGESKGEHDDVRMIRKTARLFVRNLPYSTTEDDLQDHFSQYGQIEEVRVQLFLCAIFLLPANYDESRDRDI